MLTLLTPAVLLVLVYAPGACLNRLLPTDGRGRGLAEHRLFHELLLGTAAVSWVGLLLAELGVFRLANLLVALAVVSTVALAMGKRPSGRYGRADLTGIGIALLATAWVAPPFDTLIYGSDSSVYQAGGIHLAQSGHLEFVDPTIQSLSPAQQSWLLRSASPDGVSPPYVRLAGGFTLADRTSPAVLPAFHHLFMVWTALFVSLGGMSAAPWAATWFAGLALWAIYRFAADLDGLGTGIICVLLLLALAPQYWYCRFPMPEVASQYFLWAGLGSFVAWQRGAHASQALYAAIALGMTALMRADQLLLLAIPVVWVPLLSRQLEDRAWIPFFALLSGLWLHAVMHLLIFRTHYFSFARNLWLYGLTLLTIIVLLVGLGLWLSRRRPAPISNLWVAIALTASVTDLMFLVRLGEWNALDNVGYLLSYTGVPLLIAALAGGCLLRRQRGLALFALTLAVAAIHVLFDPRAQPVPLWVARRFVPMLLPGLAVLGSVGLAMLYRSGQKLFSTAALAACLFVPAGALIPLTVWPLYPRASGHLQVIAALLPEGSVILAEKTNVLPTQLLPALWAIGGTLPYLIEPDQGQEAAALIRSLGSRPVFWLSVGDFPPMTLPGFLAQPIARYEFPFPAAGFERYRERVTVLGMTRVNVYRVAPRV